MTRPPSAALSKVSLIARDRRLQGRARFHVEVVEQGEKAFPIPRREHGFTAAIDHIASASSQHAHGKFIYRLPR